MRRSSGTTDPDPRSRRVFSFHRPESFGEWLRQAPLSEWVDGWRPHKELERRGLDLSRPATLRARLRAMPDVHIPDIWQNKVEGTPCPSWAHFPDWLNRELQISRPGDRHKRKPTWSDKSVEGRWRAYNYDELLARDKVSLDTFWLRWSSSALPDLDVLAAEIAEDLRSALEQIDDLVTDLPSG